MGLLDQLWDDTVAGPRPENGLGKLRKHQSFSFRPSSGKEGGSMRSYDEISSEEAMKVTRSIMIVKPPGYQSGSPPVSPGGSTPPVSPFSEVEWGNEAACLAPAPRLGGGGGAKDPFRFRRRSTSDAYEKASKDR